MKSILIVDDQESIRQVVREILEAAGYRVDEASTGREGLAQYRRAPADLILMDIFMPDGDGLESLVTLRQEFPDCRVVAISGSKSMVGPVNFLHVAKILGAKNVLEKPFAVDDLLGVIANELKP
ncbi:MAG: response regulator [Nitrospira sp.]|jgi:CheY-like chemotaxis protein|nr:response regulator [Nitrospira sp.]MBP6604702.1 response regulator [Nitrospira sp.]MCI1280883.1 response regulator [Nitrospira sp.]HQY58075.1 response regulator [Nitrospira sp.]HRA96656.1 response regulator [Nitrospira sp.]